MRLDHLLSKELWLPPGVGNPPRSVTDASQCTHGCEPQGNLICSHWSVLRDRVRNDPIPDAFSCLGRAVPDRYGSGGYGGQTLCGPCRAGPTKSATVDAGRQESAEPPCPVIFDMCIQGRKTVTSHRREAGEVAEGTVTQVGSCTLGALSGDSVETLLSVVKLERAHGGCLGDRRRRRTWLTAICPGEP